MKIKLMLLLFLMASILYPQEPPSQNMFSQIRLSFLGGANFSTIPKVGGSLQFGAKANLTSGLDLIVSSGYFALFEKKEYTIKSYSAFNIDDTKGYQLQTYSIDQLEHAIIPVNLGIEYTMNKNKISPFGILEVGYNFYGSEENVNKSFSGQTYQDINEIPNEYLNGAPTVVEGSGYNLSAGVGVKFIMSSVFHLDIRYVYRYNETIINNNQFLIGLTF